MNDISPKKAAVQYLSEHRIPAVMEHLVAELVQTRPGEDALFRTMERILKKTCTTRYKDWRTRVESMKEGGFEEGLSFTVPEKPGRSGSELLPGGMERPVKKEDCEEFIRLVGEAQACCVNEALLDGTFTLPANDIAEGKLMSLGYIRNSLNIMIVTQHTQQQWDSFGLVWAAPKQGRWEGLITNGLTKRVAFTDKLKFLLESKSAIDIEEARILEEIVRSEGMEPATEISPNHKSSQNQLNRMMSGNDLKTLRNKTDITKEEWEAYNITWSAPPVAMVQKKCGEAKPVAYRERMSYFAACDEYTMQGGNVTIDLVRRFSPTHFAKDLFSPNSLEEGSNEGEGNESGVPSSIPTARPSLWQEHLDTYRQEFEPIIEALEEVDYDSEEWEEMEVRWCVYMNGEKMDLIPKGAVTPVKLTDKAIYCDIARKTLNRTRPAPTQITIPPNTTEATWEDLNITWCAISDGVITDIIPNGRCIPVHFSMRDFYLESQY
eukprot:TRINITY_DN19290_c0_g1_i2.p1 TRINITY_DN19290_c0_g1~~TRINITY_DN19290_c0_g1_i2.p1  ORF type:complete len:492 (+),score=128.91 TRINITY_DN19290_c0_g1_i2:66-1541(+)